MTEMVVPSPKGHDLGEPKERKRRKKMHECRYCGSSFSSKSRLQHHYRRNLWESCIIERRDGTYDCTICDRKFDSVYDFVSHWNMDHDDAALQWHFLGGSGEEESASPEWRIRSMERALIGRLIRQSDNKKALRYGDWATHLIRDEMDDGVKDLAMTVFEILGIPGVGKSLLGLSIARQMQRKWKYALKKLYEEDYDKFLELTGEEKLYIPTIRIGFNMKETTSLIRMSRMGDIVIQDEDPSLAGFDARSVQNQIDNLLKIMRQECINLIFISPTPVSYVGTPNGVLEALAKEVDYRWTLAAVFDRKHIAHGWLISQIISEEDPILSFYEKMKTKNLKELKEQSGRETANIDKDMLERDAKKLKQFLININWDFHDTPSLSFLKPMTMIAGIKGSTTYIEAVCRYLVREINMSPIPTESDVGEKGYGEEDDKTEFFDAGGEVVFELEDVFVEVIRDPDEESLLRTIYESTEEAVEKREERGEGFKKFKYRYDNAGNFFSKHAEAWKLSYIRGYTIKSVAESLARYGKGGTLSDSAIANSYHEGGWRAIYQEEIIGEAAEIAVKKHLFPGDEWEVVGGYGKPDIVKHEDDTWVEVKIRDRLRHKERIQTALADFERKHVLKGNPLKIVRVGYTNPRDKPRYRVEIWDVRRAEEEEIEGEIEVIE